MTIWCYFTSKYFNIGYVQKREFIMEYFFSFFTFEIFNSSPELPKTDDTNKYDAIQLLLCHNKYKLSF